MKKFLYSILLALLILLPISVFAEGYVSVSPSSLTIEQGSSKTFTITAYNAIGDVSIKTNNGGIASVNTGTWETGMVGEKETKSGVITVTGNKIGTTTITIVVDAATFDNEDLAGQTKKISVNVIAKPSSHPSNITKPDNNKIQNNLSTNNNLKELSVEGYNLNKLDANNYTLVVRTDVDSINVKSTPEDEKAKISGVGAHNLKIGENNIELLVTSESGAQNKINIKVTRKDGFDLDDLDSVLIDDNNKINININSNSIISKKDISKIKESKKIVNFNYYDENKKLIYTWTIDGKEIKKETELSTNVSLESKYQEKIYESSNYADGILINLSSNKEIPTGTKFKIYVGNKYKDKNNLKLYLYNNNLELVKNDLKIKDGYIEFDVSNGKEYFVTRSNINNESKTSDSSLNIFLIVSIIELIIIFLLLILYILRVKKDNKTLTACLFG